MGYGYTYFKRKYMAEQRDFKKGDRVIYNGPYNTVTGKLLEVKPTSCYLETSTKTFWVKKADLELL